MSEPADDERTGSRSPRDRNGEAPGIYRIGWVFYLLMAIAGVLWIGLGTGDIPLSLFLAVDTWWIDLGLGLGAGGLLLGSWRILERIFPIVQRLEGHFARLLAGLDPAEAVALAVVSSFAEEVFFRGAMQGAWGFLPAALLFAVLHTGSGKEFRLWTVFALLAGLLLGGLMLWRGNLLAPIVAHLVVNGINLRKLAMGGSGDGSSDRRPDRPAD